MKEYICTKIVQAEPAWKITDEDGSFVQVKSDHGCCKNGSTIEDGYKVVDQDGYESWSPKDVFEAAYRETSGMNMYDRILGGVIRRCIEAKPAKAEADDRHFTIRFPEESE